MGTKKAYWRWIQEETDLLKAWINDDPGRVLSCTHGDEELSTLLPDRSQKGIYLHWLKAMKEMGLWKKGVRKYKKRRPHIVLKSPTKKDNINAGIDFASLINDRINEIIVKEVARRINGTTEMLADSKQQIEKLSAENTELKDLLRKLRKVREAVESFTV